MIYELEADEVGVFYGPLQVTCLEGRVWITQTGDLYDHILIAGERVCFGEGEKICMERLVKSRARFQVQA